VDSSQKKEEVFINCWTIFLLESQVGNGVKKEQTSAENQLLRQKITQQTCCCCCY
jgi:hypothetical protein